MTKMAVPWDEEEPLHVHKAAMKERSSPLVATPWPSKLHSFWQHLSHQLVELIITTDHRVDHS